ncbi:MAG: gas vesicle protein GvpN [Nostoc sp. DedQUE08]|uniref:gas vesicle protein GvpN n=1 Tax=Nostoc sp. DedQUE08 TaxID=3075393 RepID=UPI002AD56219|nr:gas vesicle protein GvpN [Nostoc sp. DedQUE08]MDZ8068077.1 gas vesicle protein GvpN [Nostoc sp. DedQUE08]
MTTVLNASPQRFVNTPAVQRIAQRALRYLQSGFSVHLRGAAGVGKTTLAMHLADLLNQPIILLFGDDEFKTSDLIGNQLGYTRKKVVDNFIHSVVKVEDELRQHWVDARLTLACKEGFTLVYDEFNRSHPEVNNVLLSVLEERLLVLPTNQQRAEYIRVHPQFRAILTSNPQEYCGVHATQDALMDRVITIDMPPPDELTQQEIVVHKTGIDSEKADKIVRLVRMFWSRSGSGLGGGLRSCLMIARICHEHEISINFGDSYFQDICADILLSRTNQPLIEATRLLEEVLSELHHSTNTQSQPTEIIPDSQNQIVLEQRVPYEHEVYNYLCNSPGRRFSELAVELGIDRSQIVAALKSLREQGVLVQMQGNAEPQNISQTVAFDSGHLINK